MHPNYQKCKLEFYNWHGVTQDNILMYNLGRGIKHDMTVMHQANICDQYLIDAIDYAENMNFTPKRKKLCA